MFCMECGTRLPDGAKFCMNCGTRVGQTAESAAPAENKAPAAPVRTAPAAPVRKTELCRCSERGQSMVFVPDTGLFFIKDENSIAYLPVGEKKCKKAVRKNPNRQYGIYSLAYYDGLLYYWIFFGDGSEDKYNKLMSLDPVTLERKLVMECDSAEIGYVDDGYTRPMLYGDAYYTIHNGSLVKVSLPGGQVTLRELPDLRDKPLPEEWKKPTGYITVDEETLQKKNYGENDFSNFRTVGGYGYISLSGGAPCTIRFPLSDPKDFEFMPFDCCTGFRDYGLLTEMNGVLYSGMVGLRESGFWLTAVSGGRVGKTIKALDLNSHGLNEYGINSWWRMGKTVYTGQFSFNAGTRKFTVLPAWARVGYNGMEIKDFAEDDRGGCYAVWDGLYYFPQGWEESGSELSDFRVEEFD